MFMTTNNTKMNIPVPIAAPGESYWASVHVNLHSPWFLVVYEIGCDEEDLRTETTVLVSKSIDVVAIGMAVKIVQIAIVTPSWMNRTKGWKMESLKEIWDGFAPNDKGGNFITICVTKGGARYVIGASDTLEDDLPDLRRVF